MTIDQLIPTSPFLMQECLKQGLISKYSDDEIVIHGVRRLNGYPLICYYYHLSAYDLREARDWSELRVASSRNLGDDPSQNISRVLAQVRAHDFMNACGVIALSRLAGRSYAPLVGDYGAHSPLNCAVGVRTFGKYLFKQENPLLFVRDKFDLYLREWRWILVVVVGDWAIVVGWIEGAKIPVGNPRWYRNDHDGSGDRWEVFGLELNPMNRYPEADPSIPVFTWPDTGYDFIDPRNR